ncbi:GlmU family protein [bacterium]|nr:GlmU family protein [bacterium]
MTHPVCIFEDDHCSQLHPLALTRPVFDLRCGISTLKDKIVRQFPNRRVVLYCRGYLKDLIRKENPQSRVNELDREAALFINGRLVIDRELVRTIDSHKECLFIHKNQVIAAFLKKSNAMTFANSLTEDSGLADLGDVKRVEIDQANLINYPWDLVHQNATEIELDFNFMNEGGLIEGNVSTKAVLINEKSIHIDRNSTIKPGAILDADNGPIYLGENVMIMHNAVIEGPAFIGDGSAIKIAAKIYEGTSIGEVCKVGGEVEESIIHSYSNKQHDGFLGHAYLGQWVNLGADTNNSDLKNNYGNVKVYINGELVDSETMFAGLFMGDHSKAGINTMFNTGTTVGTMCNVFGAGFLPKYIPSFSWGGAESLVEYDLTKAIETSRQVMARRDKDLSPEYEGIFRYVYEATQNERVQHYQ